MDLQAASSAVKKEINKLRALETIDKALDDLSKVEQIALAAEARAKTAAMELERDVKALVEHKESSEYMKQSSIEEYDKLVALHQTKIDELKGEESGLVGKLANLKTQYRRAEAAHKNVQKQNGTKDTEKGNRQFHGTLSLAIELD